MWRTRTSDTPAGSGAAPLDATTMRRLAASRRIAIIGNQGAGKTTLARRIATMTGRAFLDREWQVPSPGPERRVFVEMLTGQDDWIVDGDFGLCSLADTIIHLDFPKHVCLWRASKRALRGGWSMLSADLARPQRLARRAWVGFQAMGRLTVEILLFDGARQALRPGPARRRLTIVLRSSNDVERLLHELHAVRR